MSQTISAPATLKLLPSFMRDDEANIALSSAVDALIADPGARTKQLRVWDQIDELPEQMLDELAWELNIDWYKDTMSVSVKRATIKMARLIKEHRGTKWAVEQLVSSIFGSGTVVEWYEYGGKPHHYKVTTEYPDYSAEVIEEFKTALAAAQRSSSVLDVIEFIAYSAEISAYANVAGVGAQIVESATAVNY